MRAGGSLGLPAAKRRRKKVFFFEKRTEKLFLKLSRTLQAAPAPEFTKVFLITHESQLTKQGLLF